MFTYWQVKTVGTLYTGVTSDLVKRVWQHKGGEIKGFTSRYKVHHLVWYEVHEDILNTIQREKKSKNGGAYGKSR